MSEGYSDAYEELGGHTSQIDPSQARAMYYAGLVSAEVRARVAAEIKREQDAAQHLINKAGAEAYRSAGIELDKARGVDTDSREYLVKQLISERNRARRF